MNADSLREIREYAGERVTRGISDQAIADFAERDPDLRRAISAAIEIHRSLREEWGDDLALDEQALTERLQDDFVNFYTPKTINPYVPLAAAGPWIVTTHGAVLHDSGGYGMLGLGHAPPEIDEALSHPWVMANVMTPQFSQKRLADRLKKEIGHQRGHCPFSHFICMNSGSESVSVASRICDIHALKMTGEGGPHEGRTLWQVSLTEGFHGRTYRAARVSDSTRAVYEKHLASFQEPDDLHVVEPNDVEGLRELFRRAEEENAFIEAVYLEPVMGEGEPGLALEREFYDVARELTREHGSLLIVDSIQAALRAAGCLSLVDYPGFEDCDAPDAETYSKALNAGQYPLSVLALREEAASLYEPGVYGNTMTTNPRALEVGCAVLDAVDEDVRRNIRERGAELRAGLEALADEFPGGIRKVSGTGLMVNAELDPDRYTVVGDRGFEHFLRTHGVAMIHGGHNGLRFTPHFRITREEIRLILDTVREGMRVMDLKQKTREAAAGS
jgi:acetylornithine/succinyldiaminopimelate/putrescine aminotransferase